MSAVTVDLNDLTHGKVDNVLPEAFGPDSLGIILVNGLSDEYYQLRRKVLRSACDLAHLPKEKLDKLEHAESKWLVGWSKGKEKLVDGRPDEYKGSYYINCAFYKDPSLEGPPAEVAEDPQYGDLKGYTASNIWPSEQDIPQFEANVKRLITIIIDTAAVVAAACDRYALKNGYQYPKGYLERIVRQSTTTKARLLHYFAPNAASDDAWCGEHLDHGCLTGLTRAMLFDKDGNEVASSDPKAGLFIKNRKGDVVKVTIPDDCLAFQTGEALELITSGQFKAVPHFVHSTHGVCRNTLAVFCQPDLHEKVAGQTDFAQFCRTIVQRNH